MDTRVAVISIIVENPEAIETLNHLLHDLCLVYFCCYRMRTRMTAGMLLSFSLRRASTAPVASSMV